MQLERPLVVFDLETTGTDRAGDRIVEFGAVCLLPDGARRTHAVRVNPGRPIPPSATRVHGISDADVAGCPPFTEVAPGILALFEGADIGGFNVLDFDLPLLAAEMARAGLAFPPAGARVLDAKVLYHLKERRTLADAVRFYCGRELADAHAALADAEASAAVLLAQVERYPDLPRDAAGLAALCSAPPPGYVDRGRRFAWRDGVAVCDFGAKHKGRPLAEIVAKDASFLDWMLRADFPEETKFVVREALAGRLPLPPAAED